MKSVLNALLASNIVRRVACVCLAILGVIPQASAQYATWKFAGTITSTTQGGIFYPGESCSWSFAVNTSLLTTTSSGLYFPIGSYLFSAGTYGAGGSSLGSGVLIANDQPAPGGGSFDGIIFSPDDQSSGFPVGTKFDGTAYGVTLANYSSGSTATPFSDTSFPSTLDLNQFSQRDMTMYFQGGGNIIASINDLYINGALVSAVPEPGTDKVMFFGVLLFGGSCLWKRSQKREALAS